MAEDKLILRTGCVGCQHNQRAVQGLVDDPDWEEHATMAREPDNEYDPKAIALYYKGKIIGHVPRKDLDDAHAFLDEFDAADGKYRMDWALIEAKFRDGVLNWFDFEVVLEPVEG